MIFQPRASEEHKRLFPRLSASLLDTWQAAEGEMMKHRVSDERRLKLESLARATLPPAN